jgi:hypothetical protein
MSVTGNVGGGRHFRGIVPYGSVSESDVFLDDEGSIALNSFIRRSAGSPYYKGGTGLSTPYYHPLRTVTSMSRAGSSGLSTPTVVSQGSRSYYTPPPLPETISDRTYLRQEPLFPATQEIEKRIAAEQILKERVRDLDDSLLNYDYLPEHLRDKEKLAKEIFNIPEELQPLSPDRLIDKQMQEETEQLKPKVPEYLNPDKKTEPGEEGLEKEQNKVDKKERTPEETVFDYENTYAPKYPEPIKIPKVDPADAARIRGKHKTFKSLAEARFKEYMQAGDEFMKEGKYYKAADSYALASVWEERDAAAYAKRSYALFAAGEYMSSSYWLTRAITLSKEYAAKKVDLASFIGDRDTFENRIIEMSNWLQINKTEELAFLMAYVLYQDGKAAEAKEAIDIAFERMPDNQAVLSLKEAIEGKDVTE